MASIRDCLFYLKEKNLAEPTDNLQQWELLVSYELAKEFPDITDNITDNVIKNCKIV